VSGGHLAFYVEGPKVICPN